MLVSLATSTLHRRGLFVVLVPLGDEQLHFLVESDDFFAFVVRQDVDAGCRVLTDTLNNAITTDPSGVEGRWHCRLLAVRVSSPCTATSARTLVHVAQTVPQVRAVANVKREVFGKLACHRGRSSYGLAGRVIEHEQEYPAGSQWKTAREGVEGRNCSQRVMVPWRHFQAMRPSVSRRRGQRPRYRETHGASGRTSGIVGMLGPWC